jgi:hypothetical protein
MTKASHLMKLIAQSRLWICYQPFHWTVWGVCAWALGVHFKAKSMLDSFLRPE